MKKSLICSLLFISTIFAMDAPEKSEEIQEVKQLKEYMFHPRLVKNANTEKKIRISLHLAKKLLQEKKEFIQQCNAQMPLLNRLYVWMQKILYEQESDFEKRVKHILQLKESLPWVAYVIGKQDSPYFLPQEVVLKVVEYTGYTKEFFLSPKDIITELLPYCQSLHELHDAKKCSRNKDKRGIISCQYNSSGNSDFVYCCPFDEFIDDSLSLNDELG